MEWIINAAYDLPELFGPINTVMGLTEILPDTIGPKFLISISSALVALPFFCVLGVAVVLGLAANI